MISIHALREEGDSGIHGVSSASPIFLSTPSVRRATHHFVILMDVLWISIHALREEGDVFGPPCVLPFSISIHALREEGDFCRW